MPVRIFHHETNAREEWLDVDDDVTVTYHIENSGWPMMKAGIGEREKIFTAKQAKAEWPSYAEAIDKAVASIKKSNSN